MQKGCMLRVFYFIIMKSRFIYRIMQITNTPSPAHNSLHGPHWHTEFCMAAFAYWKPDRLLYLMMQ